MHPYNLRQLLVLLLLLLLLLLHLLLLLLLRFDLNIIFVAMFFILIQSSVEHADQGGRVDAQLHCQHHFHNVPAPALAQGRLSARQRVPEQEGWAQDNRAKFA